MFFCYVDESGDSGKYDPINPSHSGTPYFILAGLLIDVNKWKISLNAIKGFRRQLVIKAYMPYEVEFHCAEMIDPRKVSVFKQISVSDRWDLIRQFAATIGQLETCRIIAVVIDKAQSHLMSGEYSITAITMLYQAYEEFLRPKKCNGLVFFDRANEKTITAHVRTLMGTGSSGKVFSNGRIGCVIEDPIYRVSSDSLFIQAADMVAYSLKEQEFPVTARKKFNADRIFRNFLMGNCIRSTFGGEDGVIRI